MDGTDLSKATPHQLKLLLDEAAPPPAPASHAPTYLSKVEPNVCYYDIDGDFVWRTKEGDVLYRSATERTFFVGQFPAREVEVHGKPRGPASDSPWTRGSNWHPVSSGLPADLSQKYRVSNEEGSFMRVVLGWQIATSACEQFTYWEGPI